MKKIISIILLLTMLLCAFTFTASAADEVDINESSVESDLKSKYSNLSIKFPKNSLDTKMYLVSFLEYGYSSTLKEKSADYGLYLYIYNPSGKDIISDTNKVQFATSWKDDGKGNLVASDYKKYVLVLLDKSEDNVLIKLKVKDPDSALVYKSGESRRYDISGVEMNEKNYTYKDYSVGYSYTFTGYGKGMSIQSKDKSTLKCELGSFLTLKVEAHQVSYLTGDSALGAGYSNQINSVYFSIPSDIEDKYGDLYSIKYEYYHYYTSPIVVTDNWNSYKVLEADRGKLYYDGGWNYNIGKYTSSSSGGVTSVIAYVHYGMKIEDSLVLKHTYFNVIDPLTSVFYDSDGWKSGDIVKSADELQAYFRNYNLSYHNGRVFDYSADLFDLNKSTGYHVDEKNVYDTFSLASYKDAHNNFLERWFDGIFDASKYDESIENARYIQKVDADIKNDDASSKYLVSSNKVDDLKSFYNAATKKGDNVYLLRYAAADDYYSLDVYGSGIDGNFLMAQGNVYLNFDFIYFTFGDKESHTVIAAVSDLTDGFFDVTDTTPEGLDLDLDEFRNLLKILFAVIVLLIIVVFFFNVVVPLFEPLLAGLSSDAPQPRPPRSPQQYKNSRSSKKYKWKR